MALERFVVHLALSQIFSYIHSVDTIKKKTETIIDANNVAGLEINLQKTK
jgi:hypothetical protein